LALDSTGEGPEGGEELSLMHSTTRTLLSSPGRGEGGRKEEEEEGGPSMAGWLAGWLALKALTLLHSTHLTPSTQKVT